MFSVLLPFICMLSFQAQGKTIVKRDKVLLGIFDWGVIIYSV